MNFKKSLKSQKITPRQAGVDEGFCKMSKQFERWYTNIGHKSSGSKDSFFYAFLAGRQSGIEDAEKLVCACTKHLQTENDSMREALKLVKFCTEGLEWLWRIEAIVDKVLAGLKKE